MVYSLPSKIYNTGTALGKQIPSDIEENIPFFLKLNNAFLVIRQILFRKQNVFIKIKRVLFYLIKLMKNFFTYFDGYLQSPHSHLALTFPLKICLKFDTSSVQDEKEKTFTLLTAGESKNNCKLFIIPTL